MRMPEAIVGVIRRAGRVLVIQRGPATTFAGHWSPPTGRLEVGESQEQALVREMHEELGIHVRPIGKVWESTTDNGAFRLHWWTAEEDGSDLRPDPLEVSDARWVTSEEFLALEPTFQGGRNFFGEILPLL
jgi:8-oxo-dGTP diphosphatase